jgi:hypothetical protein
MALSVSAEEVQELALNEGMAGYFEMSAKQGDGIDDFLEMLGEDVTGDIRSESGEREGETVLEAGLPAWQCQATRPTVCDAMHHASASLLKAWWTRLTLSENICQLFVATSLVPSIPIPRAEPNCVLS